MIRAAASAAAPLLVTLAGLGVLTYAHADPLQRRIVRDRFARTVRRASDRLTGASLAAWASSPAAEFARSQRDRLIAAEMAELELTVAGGE